MKILKDWRFLSTGLALYLALLFLLYQDHQSTISPEEILQREPDHTMEEEMMNVTPVVMERESIQEIMENLPRREQTRQGITVRVDKIVFERIYNVPEFLESEILAERKGDARDDIIRLVRKTKGVVRLVLSIEGKRVGGGMHVVYPRFSPGYSYQAWTAGRSCWQKDMPGWTGGPTTMVENCQLVDEGVKMEDIFPLSATVKLQVKADAPPIEFKFAGLRP